MSPLVERGRIYGGSLYADTRESLKREDYLHYAYDVFDSPFVCFDDAGYGDPTGAAGDENRMISAQGNYFEYHIIGTQSILCPAFDANGLNISMDQASGDGVELTQGITARSRGAFTCRVAEKPFTFRVQASIADASGAAEFAVGFRKVEAYQAALDDYDELVCLNMIGTPGSDTFGNINIETILNGGTTSTTDTTDNWADAATVSFTVNVSDAGVVTFEIDDAAPTTTAAFTFDNAEVVIPFVYFKHSSDVAGTVYLKSWECRYDRSVPLGAH